MIARAMPREEIYSPLLREIESAEAVLFIIYEDDILIFDSSLHLRANIGCSLG